MINGGKCPSCQKTVSRAVIEHIDIGPGLGAAVYKGVSFSCPNIKCRHVFGVEIDPVAMKSDIITGVKQALGR